MPDNITDWLESIDYGQYAEQFIANDIDLELLPELTHDLLEKIGVSSVGHRLRILKAAAALRPAIPESSGAVTDAHQERGAGAVAQQDAERRQLTVMFCDLVDSTGLSTRLDPEDLREVVQGYQQAAEKVIYRFAGHVAQYLGDGLLVYFGFPQAHENDAQRAVYAGLGITEAMAALNQRLRRKYSVELAVRIGIHTGPVVVGQIGSHRHHENLALGETPNLAARLEGLSKPNSVTISASTRRLLGESFIVDALGSQTLKGIAQPVSVFSVRGEQLTESRFTADHASDTGMIVGRDEDLEALERRWQLAHSGEGQMVLLTGEPGIGKSRVIQGVTDLLSGVEHVRLAYQCSPYHTDTALFPAFTQLRRAARIDTTDSPEKQLDKLETLLYKGSEDISLAGPLLGSMMGMGEAVQARYGDTDYSPSEQRTQALHVLVEQLFSLARKRPVLFIIEDAHWIDPTTKALTELILKQFSDHRVFLLVTTRPGFEDNYGAHSNLKRISLSRLTRNQAGMIVSRVTQGKSFPEELVDEILAKADGVPLFVEEITKTILESGSLIETDDAYKISGSVGAIAVPSSLQDSLMARLDKLQSIKIVAQTAACIGRQFSFKLLNALLPMVESSLALALNQLVANELLVADGEPPKATYLFKHALVRDAAYESQLKTKRQQIHRDILIQLESDVTPPQVLAHHAMQAGHFDRAVEYWAQAGDFAFNQPAYLESISSYERALRIIQDSTQITQTDETKREALRLTRKLIRALSAGRGLTHADTAEAVRAEQNLQEQVGDASEYFEATFNLMNVDVGMAKFDKVHAQSNKLCIDAEENNNDIERVIAYRMRAFSAMSLGNIAEALPDYELALSIYDPSQDKEVMQRFGINNGIALRCSMAQTLTVAGHAGRAAKLSEGLEQTARDLNVPATLGFCLSSMATTLAIGRSPDAREFGLRTLEVVKNYELVAWVASVMAVVGGVLYDEEEFEEAAELLSQSLSVRRENGGLIFMPYHLSLHAAAQIAIGSKDADASELELASLLENGCEQWSTPECIRVLADAHYRRDRDADTAIAKLEGAIDMARTQGAALWELRAAVNLAQMHRDNNSLDIAQVVLQPVIQAFPADGHELSDYKRATELLGQLH